MRLILTLVIVGVVVYGAGDIAFKTMLERGSNAALILTGIDRGSLEQTILRHYRSKILNDQDALQDAGAYVLDTTYADINGDGRSDVIAKIESEDTCGSGGCIATIFIQNDMRVFEALNFEYAVHNIELVENVTGGMRDLRINGDTKSTMSWDGVQYVLN